MLAVRRKKKSKNEKSGKETRRFKKVKKKISEKFRMRKKKIADEKNQNLKPKTESKK